MASGGGQSERGEDGKWGTREAKTGGLAICCPFEKNKRFILESFKIYRKVVDRIRRVPISSSPGFPFGIFVIYMTLVYLSKLRNQHSYCHH